MENKTLTELLEEERQKVKESIMTAIKEYTDKTSLVISEIKILRTDHTFMAGRSFSYIDIILLTEQ